jgi:hypothetical protein
VHSIFKPLEDFASLKFLNKFNNFLKKFYKLLLVNVWRIKINGFYKNLKVFSKISKNFIKPNINYNLKILKMLDIKTSYYRIFGNYPIYEGIYIDGGFLYPRAFEILLPYILFLMMEYIQKGVRIYFQMNLLF